VQRDRVVGIDQSDLGIEKPDLSALAFDRGLDRLVVQQAIDNANIFFHFRQLDGAEPHRAPRRKTGADAKIDTSWRQPVEGRQRIRGNRRDAVRRHQHAGAESDA
jgi:hypothetical protein